MYVDYVILIVFIFRSPHVTSARGVITSLTP